MERKQFDEVYWHIHKCHFLDQLEPQTGWPLCGAVGLSTETLGNYQVTSAFWCLLLHKFNDLRLFQSLFGIS
jgi:hypothetical protein